MDPVMSRWLTCNWDKKVNTQLSVDGGVSTKAWLQVEDGHVTNANKSVGLSCNAKEILSRLQIQDGLAAGDKKMLGPVASRG